MTARIAVGFFLLAAIPAFAFGDESTQDIVAHCIEQTKRVPAIRHDYTYREHLVIRDLDPSGKTKKTHSWTNEIIYFAGKPYEHELQKDDKPLSAEESQKEERKLDHAAAEAAKLTDQEKAERLKKLQRERLKDLEPLFEAPAAFIFEREADTVLNGRPAFVLSMSPRSDYHGKYHNILHSITGRLFVDKHDYTLVKLEASVLNDFKLGLFLAAVRKGSRFSFVQARINDEVWLPQRAAATFNARALVKTFREDQEVEFSDYHKYQAESRIVAAGP